MRILIHSIHAAWLLIPAGVLAQQDQAILPTQIQAVYALAAEAGFDREEVNHVSIRTLGAPIEQLTRHGGAGLIIIYRSLARGFEGRVDPATGLMSTAATQRSTPARPEPRRTAPEPQLPPPPAARPAAQPSSPVVPVTGRTLIIGPQRLRTMAIEHANSDHDGTTWRLGGGLLTAGATFLGSMMGAGIAEFPGFLIGAGLGAVGSATLMSGFGTGTVPIPKELESASPVELERYRQAYVDETRQLRKGSIYSGLWLAGRLIVGFIAGMIGLVLLTF